MTRPSTEPTNTLGVNTTPIPFYRDSRVLTILVQVVFLIIVIAVLGLLVSNVQRGLSTKSIDLSFDFLGQTAGFQLSEGDVFGTPYTDSDSYIRAFLLGVSNTLKVAGLGIVVATLFGLIIGISRLSSNWLVNRVAFYYVEIFRNTPLLLQLIFWYFAVILQLPPAREVIELGGVYLSNKGLVLPWITPSDNWGTFLPVVVMGCIAGVVTYVVLARQRAQTGKANPAGWVGLAIVATAIAGAVLAIPNAFTPDTPVRGNFGINGGLQLSPEFAAIVAGLVSYTSAFIAEIVRAGIQAVPKGQWEASRALGLSPTETLQLVILPQALRVIIPPLGNQYLNLTKNSSLGVAVGFPELFFVVNTAGNQSGKNIQAIMVGMVIYLVISLTISISLNIYNRATRIKAR
jgi:general L-amino acid transport system permease protein